MGQSTLQKENQERYKHILCSSSYAITIYHEILKSLERFVVYNSHVMINVYDGLDVFREIYYFINSTYIIHVCMGEKRFSV